MKAVSSKTIRKIGGFLLLFGLLLGLIQYFPVIKAEVNYWVKSWRSTESTTVALSAEQTDEDDSQEYIIPENKDFGLVIPAIGVNVAVIPQIDPFDSREYQPALSKGVAHVKDTALPHQGSNTVIFAHSSDSFYNANRYNAVFYLMNKLEQGDKLYLAYQDKLYEYEVRQKAIVAPEEINYMSSSEEPRLTLITCWPPGTTLRRMVVVAE